MNFGALTGNASTLDYYIKGINGGFNANYNITPLHEKIKEYAGMESRDIRFFQLKLSEKEYDKLINILNDLQNKPQPYKFFTYNCTHGIYNLLSNSLDSLPPPKKIMSPQDLVFMLQNENSLNYPYIFPSLRERVLSSNNKHISKLEFLEWKNMQEKTMIDSSRQKELANLRHLVYKSEKEKRNLLKRENQPLKIHGFSRLDIGTQFIKNKPNAHIRFRPLLHDISDNSNYYPAHSTLELLAFSLNANNEKIYLQELNLIHIRSAPIHDNLFKSWSWNFSAGYKQNNSALNLGFGKSFYLNSQKKIAIESLLLNSTKCNNDFDCDNFLGFEVQLNKRLISNFRYGATFEYLKNITFLEHGNVQFKTWLSYDASRTLNLYAENIFSIKKQELLGIYFRFYL